ncbi:MAG TPA: SDR family NAD-dependent epimerase/dehydratase, partial [Xanthobacteraceae bacterium]|nr:SDR family NAD-dependent epimerase/dehydratase [Xanthobacteraceae bacterium]
LAELIVDLTGSRSRVVYRPLPVDDPLQRLPDITQAKAILDWRPRTQLRVGLQRTIAYFDRLLMGMKGATSRSASSPIRLAQREG